LSVKVTPLGSVPVSVSAGVGTPVAVTVNEPLLLTTKVVLFALVIAGAWLTVMLRALVADCATTVLESVTLTVKLTGVVLAGPVGAPVMAPVLLLRLSPAGKEPAEIE
jgi:hypothetical protein